MYMYMYVYAALKSWNQLQFWTTIDLIIKPVLHYAKCGSTTPAWTYFILLPCSPRAME